MTEQWLIDGYNLLHSLRIHTRQDDLSREDLFSRVAGFAAFKNIDVLLVLDGLGDRAELETHATTHFKLIFSGKASADTVIEKYLFDYRHKKQLVVVTDDHAVSNIGRGGGAQVLGTVIFADLMKECVKENEETRRKDKSRELGFHRPFNDKLKDL